MGRKAITVILSTATFIVVMCTIILLPVKNSDHTASAQGGTPWADVYGFTRSINTWDAETYNNYWFSGVEHFWLWWCPGNRYSLCNASWSATGYKNADAYCPINYLNGNALFIFAGNGAEHYLVFEKSSSDDKSYLVDREAFSPGPVRAYLPWFNLDNMLFAGLLSCRSTHGNDPSQSIGGWWRCVKATDVVLGFNWDVTNQEAKCFAMMFFMWASTYNWTIGEAKDNAVLTTINCAGGALYGIGGTEVWSIDWDPNHPNYSNIRLGTPRFGQPG